MLPGGGHRFRPQICLFGYFTNLRANADPEFRD